jgi:hypothetical protein
MLRKIIIGIIIAGCTASLFLSYSFLKEEVKQHQDPIVAIPKSAAIIVECQNIREIWSRISETNLVWSDVLAIPEIQKLDRKIRIVDSLFSTIQGLIDIVDNKKTVISFHSNGNGSDFFIATVCNESQFILFDKLVNKEIGKVETSELQGEEIKSFATEDGLYAYVYISPFILFSSSKEVLELSLTQIKNKNSILDLKPFSDLRSTSSNSSALNCYVNFDEFARIAFPYIEKEIADKWQNGEVFPNWITFDLSLKSDAFLFSGISTTNSKNNLLSTVLGQSPQQSLIKPNLPKDIKVLKRVSISDPKRFIIENNSAYLEEMEVSCQCEPIETVSSWLGDEIVYLEHSHYDSNSIKSLLIETKGGENVLSRLTLLGVSDSIVENIHGVNIYPVNDNNLFHMFGGEFILHGDVFFCQMDNYAIFSSRMGVNKILRQWRKEHAVIQQTIFSSFSDRFMANFSSNDYYWKCNKLAESLENILKHEYFLKLNSYSDIFKKMGSISWQTSPSGKNYQYHSIALNSSHGEEGVSNSLWSLKLKSSVIRAPELMKNHRTNTLEVLIQDVENSMHLISATGKIKWSKEIEGAIIGKVKQIDVYGNNKWQMLFNTSSKIHLVDINGNEVKGFPVELKAPATNSVTVLDYEKNKEYRILVACSNKKIYNYNQEGKIIEGWNFNLTESLVVNELQHFVSESKDYILFTDISGNIYMVDRRGGKRIDLTQKINTNLHELIEFEKGFTFTASKLTYQDSNTICKIEFDDTKTCFMLDSSHSEFDLSMVDLDGNNLSDYVVNYFNRIEIYGPDKKLSFFETFDFNINHQLKIIGDNLKFFLIENEGEIYLYSSNLTPIPNFPVSGSIHTAIGDINKDGRTNVVTISSSNELKVYSIEGLEAL